MHAVVFIIVLLIHNIGKDLPYTNLHNVIIDVILSAVKNKPCGYRHYVITFHLTGTSFALIFYTASTI